MSDLIKLAERIENGQDRTIDVELELLITPSWYEKIPEWRLSHARRFTISLDAAKELHDVLLPGWSYEMNVYPDNAFVMVWNVPQPGICTKGKAETAPEAWVAAILRAKAHENFRT